MVPGDYSVRLQAEGRRLGLRARIRVSGKLEQLLQFLKDEEVPQWNRMRVREIRDGMQVHGKLMEEDIPWLKQMFDEWGIE